MSSRGAKKILEICYSIDLKNVITSAPQTIQKIKPMNFVAVPSNHGLSIGKNEYCNPPT